MNNLITISYTIFFIIVGGISLFVGALTLVANGIGYMKMAKKVDIKNGWLGFIPVASLYLLGKFAEKDNEVYKPEGKKVKWSKLLLIFSIAYLIVDVLIGIIVGVASVIIVLTDGSPAIVIIAVVILMCIMLPLAIVLSVLEYIAIYKTLHLMAPKHALWILLITILATPLAYTVAILIFGFSDKFPADMPNKSETGSIESSINEQTEQF